MLFLLGGKYTAVCMGNIPPLIFPSMADIRPFTSRTMAGKKYLGYLSSVTISTTGHLDKWPFPSISSSREKI